ncbi:syntaxin-8 [Neocloeon triangulifer]|uniref:syntaxin-8 n=1 Tax=Neocloeon triangulifer TaxID=2078957 RepID=UPI00286EE736|nr:syntaxin-8 [Neocloeon triangulifer]
MALIDVDSDPWQSELRGCENLSYEITEFLSTRSREPNRTTDNYARLSTNIRVRLKQFSVQIQQLENGPLPRLITGEERERRMREVETLKSRLVRLQNQFEDRVNHPRIPEYAEQSSSIQRPFGEASGAIEIKGQMKTLEEEQDKGLEALSKIVSRQKQIAETIGGEVETQNEILDDLAVRIDSTDTNLVTETRHVAIIDRKDATCGYWVIIILLLIAIIVVWVI